MKRRIPAASALLALGSVLAVAPPAGAALRCAAVHAAGVPRAEIEAYVQRLTPHTVTFLIHKLRGVEHPGIDAFVREMLAAPDAFARADALQILKGRRDPGFLELMRLAQEDAADVVRIASLKLLEGLDGEAVDAILRPAIARGAPAVALHAVAALKGRQDEGSRRILEEVLMRDEAFLRRQAIEFVLPWRRDPEAVRLFDLALSGRHPLDVELAMRVPEKHDRDPAALPLLRRLLASDMPNTRLLAAIELSARVRDRQAPAEVLEPALRDPSETIRTLARTALDGSD